MSSSVPLVYERIAIETFFERAARSHRLTRVASIALVAAAAVQAGYAEAAAAAAWFAAVLLIELLTQAWHALRFSRLPAGDDRLRPALRELVLIAALIIIIYTAPFVVAAQAGPEGALIGVVFCAAVLMVVAAQHNLTQGMFYTSALAPGLGLLLNLASFGHGWGLAALMVAGAVVLLNARHLQHASHDQFRSVVEAQIEAREAAARLTAALVKANAANAAKSAFLATMSHEIRTPLNGVIGMAQAMGLTAADPAQAERIAVIRRSGEALLTILNDLLDLSKVEAGHVELETAVFSFPSVVEVVCAVFAAAAEEKGVGLRMRLEDVAGHHLGDPTRVRQVLSNLIGNAVKFTERGEVVVTVRPHGTGVCVDVVDTGVGIARDRIESLFERFVQADDSTARRFGGTGLGLAISRELVRLMGGDIAVRSQEGEGSTFTADFSALPQADAPASAAKTSAPAQERSAALDGLQVLVAEDNLTNQLVIRTVLGHLGVNATVVENGALAVEAWSRAQWDLVLMDIQMPVMDGMAATRAIRQAEACKGGPRTPVIALSANAMTHQVEEHLAAGMDSQLAKPLQVEALIACLSALAASDGAGGEPDAQAA